jgi:hypothetical protein
MIDYNYTLSPGATLSLGSSDDDSVFAQTINIQPETPGDAVNVQRVEILVEGAAGAFTNPNPKPVC